LDGRDWDYQGARAAGEHGVLVWQLDLLRCGMQNLPRRFLALTFALFTGAGFAQAPPDTPTNPSSSVLQRRTMHFLDPGNGAWTADQIATMSRIRDAAVSDDYSRAMSSYFGSSHRSKSPGVASRSTGSARRLPSVSTKSRHRLPLINSNRLAFM
jgi:hypothetical protein